ncbi:serine/threonine-protein kinase [Rhodopirellula sp. JC639]|uniref:serine/threonine-protein kinase n=1 Tax=Stieleria mannarensis TaxID=2755585 RepID=UPI001602EEC6|nr:serine/threonine-protein kinase [Rhodopirellula sp. JC639]
MPAFHYQQGDRPLEGYTIQHALGRGGFGEVYFATSDAGREVALKAVQNYEDIELRGIGHCMNLKSPHLVMIFDVKQGDDGTPWVIMEYVSGASLREILDASPQGIDPAQAMFFVRELAKGIDYLHGAGIVHRDLKPHNIFFEDGVVKIGDYSLSKVITVSHASGHTMTVGSVHYMAPEISMGRYDKTVDLYALGVMLYEMLTGKPPFDGESVGEILMKHLSGEVDVSVLEEPFAGVVRKAMDRDPAKRFQSAREMADALGCESTRVSDDSIPASLSLIGKKPVSPTNPLPPEPESLGIEDLADTVGARQATRDTAESETPSRRGDAHQVIDARLRRMADARYLTRVALSFVSTILLGVLAFVVTPEVAGDLDAIALVLMPVWIWLISMSLAMTIIFSQPPAPRWFTPLATRVWLLGVWALIYGLLHYVFNRIPFEDALAGCWAGGLTATLLMDWRCFADPQRPQRIRVGRTLIAGSVSGVAAGLYGVALGLNVFRLDFAILSMAATMAGAITVQLTSLWEEPDDSSWDQRDAMRTRTAPSHRSGHDRSRPKSPLIDSYCANSPTAERVS